MTLDRPTFVPGDLITLPNMITGDVALWKDPSLAQAIESCRLKHGDIAQVISVLFPNNQSKVNYVWYLVLSPNGFGYISSWAQLELVSRGSEVA